MSRTFLLSVGAAALSAFTVTAHAEPTKVDNSTLEFLGDRAVLVNTPRALFNSAPAAEISNVIWMNRCAGGCTVMGGGINDARNHMVKFLSPGAYLVDEFQNNTGVTGTAADAEWDMLVQCVKEIYSPFNVVVTDVKPTSGNYSEAIVGGTAASVGMMPNIGGVASFTCEPVDNAISFTFSNSSFYKNFGDVKYRVWELCSIVGQESAHNFGLDHSYEFSDGTSACNDPMTYRTDCGGQKFFRNKMTKCGEDGVRMCLCGGLQNTHAKLLAAFGAGQSLIAAPTVMITSPANMGSAGPGQVVTFSAGSMRGIERNELWLNGYKWAETKGVKFGPQGQPNPSNYSVTFPAEVPDGKIDIQIKSFDDIGVETTSATVTVTKGALCTAVNKCATGQLCDADGRCYWEAPTGKLGEACDYQQFCESNMCVMTNVGGYCSQECIVGTADSCPAEFDCLPNGNQGACIPKDTGGGCCNVGHGGAVWAHGGLSLFVLGLVVRRRRRRRDRL